MLERNIKGEGREGTRLLLWNAFTNLFPRMYLPLAQFDFTYFLLHCVWHSSHFSLGSQGCIYRHKGWNQRGKTDVPKSPSKLVTLLKLEPSSRFPIQVFEFVLSLSLRIYWQHMGLAFAEVWMWFLWALWLRSLAFRCGHIKGMERGEAKGVTWSDLSLHEVTVIPSDQVSF